MPAPHQSHGMRIRLLSGIACAAWLIALPLLAQEQVPVLQYAPSDGTRYTTTETGTVTLDAGGDREITIESEMKGAVVIKREGSDYLRSDTLVSFDLRSDSGKPPRNYALEVLQGMTITFRIDADKRLVSVSGLEGLPKRIKARTPPEVASPLAKELTEERILQLARMDWEGSEMNLLGHPARVGEAWLGLDELVIPFARTQRVYMATKVTGRARVRGRECLVIRQQFALDPAALVGFLGEGGAKDVAGKSPIVSDCEVTGTAQQTVDPATLLCYGNSKTITARATVELPDAGRVPMTIQETTKCQYQYEAPK